MPKKKKNEDNPDDNFEKLSDIFDKLSTHEKTEEQKDSEVDNMCGHIEEVMSTYTIMGYTVDGEPLVLTYAKNRKDSDALAHLFNKQIMSYYNGNDSR